MENKKTKNGIVIILGIILIPFFAFKLYSLKKYNFYDGEVIAIETTDVSIPKVGKHGGGYETVYMPEVKYRRGKDTIVFTEGRRNVFAFFYDKGDTVTVIEEKLNPDNARILTFWYYIETYEIILLLLVSAISASIFWAVSTGLFKEE